MSSVKAYLQTFFGRFELVLIVLAILTLAIVFLPKNWLDQKHVLDPKSFPVSLIKDDFGATKVFWIDEEAQKWRCRIGSNNPRAFCSLLLEVVDERRRGLDLSHFDRMQVKASYEGDGETLRVYLRNRHPRYYIQGDEMSTKYNMVQAPVSGLNNGVEFSMGSFKVADWWIIQRNIPPSYNDPEFTDVIYIEFQTEERALAKNSAIQIKEIVWSTQMISNELLYRALVSAWVFVIVLRVLYTITNIRSEIKNNKQKRDEIISINQLLSVKKEQLEEQAKTDYLTGTLNRLGIREILLEGLQSWNEKKVPFSLIVSDLDHFKRINDSHGHDVGDRILVECACCLKQTVPENAFVARWGGEEFLIACKDSSLEKARDIAESMRLALEKKHISDDVKVTASFGVACLASSSLGDAFKDADDALYQAKALGRNRVCVAGEMTSPEEKIPANCET